MATASEYPRVHPKTAAEWRRWLRLDRQVLRPIDEQRSSLLFTPRKAGSGWARRSEDCSWTLLGSVRARSLRG